VFLLVVFMIVLIIYVCFWSFGVRWFFSGEQFFSFF
jgi:hypothetical protein